MWTRSKDRDRDRDRGGEGWKGSAVPALGGDPQNLGDFAFLLFFLVHLRSKCVTAVQTLPRPNWVVMLSALLVYPYFWGGEAGNIAQSLGSE